MKSADLQRLVTDLGKKGLPVAEAYGKEGRSRRLKWVSGNKEVQMLEEMGWALRAGGENGAFFWAQAGPLEPPSSWPSPQGLPLELPPLLVGQPWVEPGDLQAPLIGEGDGFALMESVNRKISADLPGARLVKAVLEDGASESRLANSEGVVGESRSRTAAFLLEAVYSREGKTVLGRLYTAEREARNIRPLALGSRLVDFLSTRLEGRPQKADNTTVILAPRVMTSLLAALEPLWCGPQAINLARRLTEADGRLASPNFHLSDNGRRPGGIFSAGIDGEGVPTREIRLVQEGRYCQPLLPWNQGRGNRGQSSGCTRRPGWRDRPRVSPSHLVLEPTQERVPSLLKSLKQGFYFFEVEAEAVLDASTLRLSIPVLGFEMENGNAKSPVRGSRLEGSVCQFLRGIEGIARDLTFYPGQGMIGSPPVLISGLNLRVP